MCCCGALCLGASRALDEWERCSATLHSGVTGMVLERAVPWLLPQGSFPLSILATLSPRLDFAVLHETRSTIKMAIPCVSGIVLRALSYLLKPSQPSCELYNLYIPLLQRRKASLRFVEQPGNSEWRVSRDWRDLHPSLPLPAFAVSPQRHGGLSVCAWLCEKSQVLKAASECKSQNLLKS